MTGTSSREKADRQLYRAIGDFLAAHHLHPGPDNYALVYRLVTDESSPVAQAVTALTGDGIRLSQEDANRIREEHEIDTGGAALTQAGEALSAARRTVESFADIIETARAETQSYGSELARGAAQLDQVVHADPTIAAIARITGAMLERTRAAEAQLQAARAEASSLREKLATVQEQALSDPLTRLPNRRAFEDRLEEVCASAALCSLAICDIDEFKRINDSHGHAVGDRVLRMVADVLRTHCDSHMVARIGGEEFVVLFTGVEPDAAGAVLDQARLDLADRYFRVRGTDAPLGRVSFSAGVVKCTDHEGQPPLKRADDLLYQAKNAGRNRVLVETA